MIPFGTSLILGGFVVVVAAPAPVVLSLLPSSLLLISLQDTHTHTLECSLNLVGVVEDSQKRGVNITAPAAERWHYRRQPAHPAPPLPLPSQRRLIGQNKR